MLSSSVITKTHLIHYSNTNYRKIFIFNSIYKYLKILLKRLNNSIKKKKNMKNKLNLRN